MKNWVLALSVLSTAAGMQLLSNSAQAGSEVCDTIEDCRALQAEVEARLAVLIKNAAPMLTGIVLRGDKDCPDYGEGSKAGCGMDHEKATRYCDSKGQRLPTARELALYAQSLGAQGISETEKDGYKLVKGSDSAGNPDHFYFSDNGYKPPEGNFGKYWFWSSSVHPYNSDNAYSLDGSDGDIHPGYRGYDYDVMVRCIQAR